MVKPPRLDVIMKVISVQVRVWREGASWVTSTVSSFISLHFYFISSTDIWKVLSLLQTL